MTSSTPKTRKRPLTAKERLIVALDVSSISEAEKLIDELHDSVGMFKIGLELYASAGTELFDLVRRKKLNVFFDGKFHDIPNTVAGAVKNTVRPGVGMLNIHTTGGSEMMRAARIACDNVLNENPTMDRPLLIGVTLLTSIGAYTLSEELAVSRPIEEQVTALAKLAQESGLDGVVASAQEAESIRKACGEDFYIVTPGIRPDWAVKKDDQSRVLTPSSALQKGADYLVVGRPITAAEDKRAAAEKIVEEMSSVAS